MAIVASSLASATRVWCIDLAAALPALLTIEAETPRLSDADRGRAARISDGQAARDWIAAHVVLRLVLERELGPDVRRKTFALSSRGKPELPDSGIAFSLSHGAGRALIATGPTGALGVDIEDSRPVRLTGDRRQAIETAGAALSRQTLPASPDARFLQAWVRLEALSKADGEGLARILTRAGAFGARRGQGVADELLPDSVQVLDLALGPGLFAAIAMSVEATGAHVCHLPVDTDGLRAFAISRGRC